MPPRVSERVGAPLLAVDLDGLTLERLRASVRGTDLELWPVSREGAVEHASSAAGPLVAILEWVEGEEEEAARFCDALRRASRPHRCHVLALGSLAEEAALLRAMEGPCDDVLCRPLGGDLLFRLLRASRAARAAAAPDTPRDALEEALRSGKEGEVAVRAGEVTAFIHVQDGHVVWANVSSSPASMEEIVRHAGVDLDRDHVAAINEECRSTGAHFMDVLIAWNLIDEARAREAIRAFVADRVERALVLPGAVALFLPRPRPRSERLLFRPSEIPSLRLPAVAEPLSMRFDAGPVSQSRAPLPLGEIAEIVQRAAAIQGAVGAAVLDRKTGASLFHAGAEMDTTVAWSQLTTLASLGPAAEDVMATGAERCFLLRPLRFAPTLAVFVALSLSSTTIGLARATLIRIASERTSAPPPEPSRRA